MDKDFREAMNMVGETVAKRFNIKAMITIRSLGSKGEYELLKTDLFSNIDPLEYLPGIIENLQEMLAEEKKRRKVN